MTTKQLLASMNFIQYPRFLGYYLGVNETVLLSELCDKDSWCELNKGNYDGWFFAKRDDILVDTGLSDKEQRTALQNLSEIGLVESKRMDIPAKTYYHINQDKLESVIETAYNDYKERKIQMLPNGISCDAPTVTSCDIPNGTSRTDGTAIHSISIINKKEEIQKDSPQDVTPKYSRRNFREKFKPLEDKLQSGEEIDREKQKKKMTPAEKIRSNCLSEIENRNYDSELKQLLQEYYLWASDGNDSRRIKNLDLWRSKLNMLDQLIKKGNDPKKIVKQSLDNRWYKFVEPENIQSHRKTEVERMNEEVIIQTDSREEVLRRLKEDKERFGVY